MKERTFSIIKPNAVKRNWIGKIVTMMEDRFLHYRAVSERSF